MPNYQAFTVIRPQFEAAHIKKTLAGLLREIDLKSIQVESLCIFIPEQADSPFLLHRRYPLGVDVAQRTDA